MTENEDPGKALLRLLQGHASPVSPIRAEHQDTQMPELHSLLPLPAADVRIAAAGGYSEPRTPRFDYHVPHPESSTSSVSRLAGEDLLRMLHQGGSPTPTSTTVLTSTSHQPVPPALPAAVPSVSMSRSVAAEHERRLRNLLSIGEGDSSSFLGPSHSEGIAQPPLSLAAPPVTPMTPLTPRSVAPPVVTASSTTVTDGAAVGNPKKKKRARNNKSRNKYGKHTQQAEASDCTGGNSQGVSNSRGKATGTSGKSTASRQDGERKLSTGSGGGERSGRSRGGRGRGHEGGTNGSNPGHEGGRGRKGSGRSTRGPRGAASPQGQSFAWSAFQNSPDPKNIPIPPLQHFLLNPEVSEDSQQVERSPPPGWHGTSITVQGDSSVLAPQELLLHTPPPPPRDLRVRPDERTSAQKVEDDIKRILRLN